MSNLDQRACRIQDCDGPHLALGLCNGHYRRHRDGRPMEGAIRPKRANARKGCQAPSCDNVHNGRGFCRRHLSLSYRYGITASRLLDLLAAQVCENKGCRSTESLALDHDHDCCPTTPACGNCVRGWLCQGCNLALGHLNEDLDRAAGLVELIKEREGANE